MVAETRILVVDDEPNIRLVFRTALESGGYVVDEARDGQEALARLAATPYALALLDLKMPQMGGMDVLRELRGRRSETPVMIVTAHGTVPDAVGAMKLGAIDFLSKPVAADVLRRVADEVIARHAGGDDEGPIDSGPLGTGHFTTVVVAPVVLDLTAAKRGTQPAAVRPRREDARRGPRPRPRLRRGT